MTRYEIATAALTFCVLGVLLSFAALAQGNDGAALFAYLSVVGTGVVGLIREAIK